MTSPTDTVTRTVARTAVKFGQFWDCCADAREFAGAFDDAEGETVWHGLCRSCANTYARTVKGAELARIVDGYVFAVRTYLNNTTVGQAIANGGDHGLTGMEHRPYSHAPFCRTGTAWRAGDELGLVDVRTVEAASAEAAAEAAFAFGGNHPELGVTWAHRSVSTGDVVVVETPDGPAAFACDAFGWAPVDLAAFLVWDARPFVGGAL